LCEVLSRLRFTLKAQPRNVIGSWLLGAEKSRILGASGALIVLIAVADWRIGPGVSLGILYIAPMLLSAVVLDVVSTAVLAIVSAMRRSVFDTPATNAEVVLRLVFSSVAYFACARFVTALVRNRQLVVEHLTSIQREQELRVEAEQQFRVLVE